VVISLKRFLDDGRNDDRVETLERVIQLLLQGFALHSIQGAPEDYTAFQSSIQEVFDSIKTAKDPKDYLVLGGAAISTIEDYQRRTIRYLSRLRSEMQRMIGMLTTSVTAISETGSENLRRLRDIESQVAAAAELDDVRQVKARLSDCLDEIRQERERQKQHTGQTVADLSGALESIKADTPAVGAESGPSHANSEVDSVTGLPGREAAQAAIERACSLPRPSHVVVIVLDNLSAINLRYGRGVGDEVLQVFGDYLAQLLPPADELFRWHGPALAALARGPEKAERVREQFVKILEKKFEHSIQTSSRNIILSVTHRWAVLPLAPTAEAVFQKIDLFISPAIVPPPNRGQYSQCT
jgi:GGDEF domain-containing protein